MPACLIYPHQLFDKHPLVNRQHPVYLVEDPLFFSQYRFHRQKLMLHRASMKRYAFDLTQSKHDVRYVEAKELHDTSDIAARLKRDKIDLVLTTDPEDNFLSRRLMRGCGELAIKLEVHTDPHFLTPTSCIEAFIGDKKKLYFTQFYIEQRKRLNYLLDQDGSPVGGKWSFDTENRKKLPKGHLVPKVTIPSEDAFAEEARIYVKQKFPHLLGCDLPLQYPSTRTQALIWLQKFADERLASFGDFEDAMVRDESFLFHACLTPMLNIGLISPDDVVGAALAAADRIPLNSLEGFIRQVIGWREFIRAVYRERGSQQRTTNFWQHTRKIPGCFYDGTTGIDPLDTVIQRVLQTGYCHHIERLMILGNFMLLCEFDPDEVYRWFMELFVDAYDWVMVPNVYGMSQHADGGLMTTKPYISGSSYVLRMSDFRRGSWCEVWDGLYWRFLSKHRKFFEKNPRMRVMTRQLDRMGDRLEHHQAIAQHFLRTLD